MEPWIRGTRNYRWPLLSRLGNAIAGGKIHENNSVFHARGENGETGRLRGPDRKTRFQIEVPPMERTNYGRSGYDAVAKRAALVGACVFNSEEAAVQIEDGDFDGRPSLPVCLRAAGCFLYV